MVRLQNVLRWDIIDDGHYVSHVRRPFAKFSDTWRLKKQFYFRQTNDGHETLFLSDVNIYIAGVSN